ncbi:hypothetical protein QS257_11880 [Terrilactibacillus sp. S3-3]|nr:hypothetical protein QS257_11880 [Terrilactibacillus sp. S3-3]
MDFEKLKQWLDTVQQFQGQDFWSDIFDQRDPNRSGPQNRGGPSTDNQPETELGNPTQLPFIDILERKNDWVVLIDLPGVEKNDVQLTIAGNQLNIKGVVRKIFIGTLPPFKPKDSPVLLSEPFGYQKPFLKTMPKLLFETVFLKFLFPEPAPPSNKSPSINFPSFLQ